MLKFKIKERIKLDKARLLLEEFSNLDIKIILEEEISEKIENNLINGKTLKIDLFSKNWREQNKVITKMPFSVGVELDDVLGMKFLVRRNEYLPITEKLVIPLPEDCDNCVIPILRGESVIASDNRKLGELTLNGIKQQPGHLLKGEVIFQITDDGLLFATFRKRQSMRGRVANTFKILSEFISPE